MKPHPDLAFYRPDEIAECFDGVSAQLYTALWNSMDDAPALKDVIDIENSCPADAIGICTVVSNWDKFTDDEKRQLNEIMEAADV